MLLMHFPTHMLPCQQQQQQHVCLTIMSYAQSESHARLTLRDVRIAIPCKYVLRIIH
jgi:hypothetical protein